MEKGNKYIYTLDLSKGCGKVDPVDPKDPQNPNVVDPDGKDPGKGENIFGEFIAFKVQVTDWVDTNNSFTIDGTTGTITTKAKKSNYYISYSQSNWRISPSYGASEFSNSFNPHWRKTIERNHYDEENL